jgi:hypothetical protein
VRTILQCAVVIVSLLFSISQAFARAGQNSDEWQFSLSPLFLWGMNIDGYSQIGPKVAPLELDFTDDVFENLAAVFTVHFEANKNDLALFGEYQYVKLDPSSSIANGPTIDVDFTVQAAEFGAGYRVVTWGNTDVEPIIGARWAYQDLEVNTRNGGLNLVDSNESWWDIFGGVRLWTHFNEEWTLISRADIGAGGSNLVWNASFIFDYQFRDWGSVFAGYRWMNYDYDNGSGANYYAYNALQRGPLLGVSFHW